MDTDERDVWFSSLKNGLVSGLSAPEAVQRATLAVAEVFQIGPPRCKHGIAKSVQHCELCRKNAAAEEALKNAIEKRKEAR